jgi:hypothetical protein
MLQISQVFIPWALRRVVLACKDSSEAAEPRFATPARLNYPTPLAGIGFLNYEP